MQSHAAVVSMIAFTLSVPPLAFAGPTPEIDVLIREGDAAPGAPGFTIAGLNAPFTNGNGVPGFTGSVEDKVGSTNFVWYDAGITWLNSDALPTVLTGAEGTMGISDAGDFIYSPSTDGDDSVWNSAGLIVKEDDPAPGLDAGLLVSFASRPQMSANGVAHFVGGWTDSPGGGTIGRVLWRVDGDGVTPVIKSDDIIGGFTVDRPGVDFDYHVSDNAEHLITVLTR